MPTAEGKKFAEKMNSAFVEASAKTAVGVKDVFQELVQRILATPELWDNASRSGTNTAHGNGGVPGGVQVVGLSSQDHDAQGGCAC